MSIRLYQITVPAFIQNELPPHKRLAARLAFYQGIMHPLQVLAEEWIAFRDVCVTRALVSGEAMSLAWYLNYVFDPINEDIYILDALYNGAIMGDTSVEAGLYKIGGDTAVDPTYKFVAGGPGEGSPFAGCSFGVYVPTGVTATDEQINAVVRQYRLAGKSFIIIRY